MVHPLKVGGAYYICDAPAAQSSNGAVGLGYYGVSPRDTRRCGMALSRRSRLAALATTIISIACGGGGGSPGPTPTQIAKAPTNDGDNQVGPAGQALATPLAVIVRDASNNPVAAVTVTWTPGAGSGSITPQSNSDANGIATATWTLGANAGAQTATAARTGLTGSPVSFNATAQIQGATQLAKTPAGSGDGQTDTVLATLPNPYRVIATDQNSNPVQGVSVHWAATVGGGAVSTPTSVTDINGIAVVTHEFGSTAGAQSVQATVAGLIGSPVTLTSTALPGIPTQIAKNGGDNQTGMINTALPTPHSVIVHDSHGNVVPMVPVAWVVGTGGGSVNPTSTSTGSNGVASTTRTLGPTLGTQTDTARTPGLAGSPVGFTATGALAVQVGGDIYNNVFFRSVHNGSQNPAVDTIPAGAAVIWEWVGSLSHGVESTGSPSFNNSSIMTGAGKSYSVTFTSPGTYTYDCLVHGVQMTGRVVVQ